MSKLLFLLSIIVIVLFFPIYLETNAHYDVNKRKLAFSICIFRFLRIFGGYIATYKGGLAIHKSQNKAVIIPYTDVQKEGKRFSILKTFQIKSFVLTTETGAEYLFPCAFTHAILRTIFFIKGGKKRNIENNLWLTDGDTLRISLNCVLFFNFFILLTNFFKFLKEKLYLCRKKSKS